MAFWGLYWLDLVAALYFLLLWLGFAPYLRWRGRHTQVVASAMIDHRRAWMEALLKREVRIADTAIVGHIMSTAAFFASTTVIVIGALLGVLINMGRGSQAAMVPWLATPLPSPIEIKVLLIIVVAVYAFQSFTWAIRQANFAAVMMGAAPPPAAIDPDLLKQLSSSMGSIITGVAESYDNGMRSYYFALGAVTWVVSPLVFIFVTTGVVFLLLRRQSKSRTALALKEIAVARSGASAT
jgi:uncharacterized membrane protein